MDRARSYSDAPDASVRIFGRESAGEMYEARFGCPVSSKFRGGPFAGRGSHIHNKPGLSVYHTGEEFASEPNWSEKIDRELTVGRQGVDVTRRGDLKRSSVIFEKRDRVRTVEDGPHGADYSLDSC